MKFAQPLVHGTLIKRYQRFLADIQLDNGDIITAHCTNSGSMKSCIEEGAEVYLSQNSNPNRRTQFTWEMIKINGNWVGINTMNPNKLAVELLKNNAIKGLTGYTHIKPEVKFGDSRFDVFAENEKEKCFIEVKNVTLKDGDYALFPDSITTRGAKHLETLISVKEQGMRAVMLYIIQREDVDTFAPAHKIDLNYAKALKRAFDKGIEIFPLQVKVTPLEITAKKLMPFEFILEK